ncbi:hypothetical protein DFAR_1150016 [Desulfarculales bacterium]
MDEVRKAETKKRKLPTVTCWTVLKAADDGRVTEKQQQTLHPVTHHPLHPPCPEVHSA